MKIAISLILSLYSYSLWASSCSLHEIEGRVELIKNNIVLILAPETASEIKLTVPSKIESKFDPYLNHFIKTEIIIASKNLNKTSRLVDIKEAKHTVYDPLNAESFTARVEKGAIKCP